MARGTVRVLAPPALSYGNSRGTGGRVEGERGGVQDRRRLLRVASFVVALAERSIAPFLVPAHRTVAIVPTRPCPLFGRPVHRRDGSRRLRPGASPHALQVPPHGGHPALPGGCRRGQRGVTLAFGYGALHPSASGTSTHLRARRCPAHTMGPSDAWTGAGSPRPLDRPPVLPVTACVRAARTTPASRATFICRCIRSPSTAFVY